MCGNKSCKVSLKFILREVLTQVNSVIFRAFLLPENGSESSVLNLVLKLNLDQRTV